MNSEINKDDLAKEIAKEIINSDLFIVFSLNEDKLEIKMNSKNAINLISMFLCSNDELFKQIVEQVHLNKAMNKSMNDDISKRN